jgi:Leucine-rich repeat (LRR) protein
MTYVTPEVNRFQDRAGDGFLIRQTRPETPVYLRIYYWSDAAAKAMRDSGATHITISSEFSGDDRQLHALRDFASQIQYLELGSKPKVDLAFVSELHGLRELTLAQSADAIDFARLPLLKSCLFLKPASLGGLAQAPALERLQLWGIKLSGLSALSSLKTLRELVLREVVSLTSLDGIEALRLERLELVYNRGLRSVANLNGSSSLVVLEISGSSAADDFNEITDLPMLERLTVSSGPALRSFDAVGNFGNLRMLHLQNTNMRATSCSIAPLLKLRQLQALSLHAGPSKGYGCITDIERLGEITSLESIYIDRGPKTSSLGFVRSLPQLRKLRLSRMEIEDGDFSVLLQAPALTDVEITPPRKHYRTNGVAAALNARKVAMNTHDQADA